MSYYDTLKDVIGRQCICCGAFVPISGVDDYGHRIEFADSGLGMCEDCFKAFKSIVSKEREGKQKKSIC